MSEPLPMTDKAAVLAIDLGSKTGWAALSPAAGPTSGREQFKKTDRPGERLLQFHGWVQGMLTAVQPSVVYYEHPLNFGRGQAGAGGNDLAKHFEALLLVACECRGIDCKGIWPSTLKKRATGNGRASKLEMAQAAEARWSHYTAPKKVGKTGCDEGDALCLLWLAMEELDGVA